MSTIINKTLLSLSVILLLTLFIGTRAIDVAYPDQLVVSQKGFLFIFINLISIAIESTTKFS
jgi:hypothetical protein